MSTTTPHVFISYRSHSMASVASGLATELRKDLGWHQVYRDKDNLIAGKKWQDGLNEAIDAATSVIFLVDGQWAQGSTTSIWDDADPVRSEIDRALAKETASAIPVLVDGAGPPRDTPSSIGKLFDRHGVAASSKSLSTGKTGGYQHVLIGLLAAARAQHDSSVLIVGDETAAIDVDRMIDEMQASKTRSVRVLARFSSGAALVTPRVAKRHRQKWPDVIVLADNPSDSLTERFDALLGYPELKTVVCGSAAMLLTGAAGTAAVASSSSPAALAAGLPTHSSFLGGVVATSIPAKAAIGATVVAGSFGAAAIVSDPAPTFAGSASIAATGDDDERFYPLGRTDDITLHLRDFAESDDAVETRTKLVVVEFAGGQEVNVGEVAIPKDLGEFNGQRDGWYRVDSVSISADGLPILGMPIEDFCYPTDDPADAIGGWEFSETSGTITANLVVEVQDAEARSTGVDVVLSAESTRRWVTAPDPALDTSRCPEVGVRDVRWSSRDEN